MASMAKLKSRYRLQGLSVNAITTPYEEAVIRVAQSHQFSGHKLRPGPLLSALVLHFLEMEEEARMAFAGRALARLEAFLSEQHESLDEGEDETLPRGRHVDSKQSPGRKNQG